MPSGSDKWIRSVKDNPAGKVVADPEGNRWQWSSDDETAMQLKKLHNDELTIERTDLHARPKAAESTAAASEPRKTPPAKPFGKRRDKGGGFNPYDNPGKTRKR